jgi:hypothetical protein
MPLVRGLTNRLVFFGLYGLFFFPNAIAKTSDTKCVETSRVPLFIFL